MIFLYTYNEKVEAARLERKKERNKERAVRKKVIVTHLFMVYLFLTREQRVKDAFRTLSFVSGFPEIVLYN
jgi:hypothetical protein